jgi:hypothetical protein
MTAAEAKELTLKCIDYNEDQMYNTVISKITVKCGEGSSNLIISQDEISLKTIKRLTDDGYEVRSLNSINLAQIKW